MSGPGDRPVVLRFTAPRLVAVLGALGLLVALGAWGGYRLGRWAGPSVGEAGASVEADAPMEEGAREGGEGFEASVDLSSGFALVYLRTPSADAAERARDELAGRGLPVRVDQDPRRSSDDRFRVLVGPYPEREAALRAAGTLGKTGENDTDLVFLE